MTKEKGYWFRTNQFGWGWGIPSCWQGWAVFVGYIAALEASRYFLPRLPQRHPAFFFIGIAASVVILIRLLRYKGDPLGRSLPR